METPLVNQTNDGGFKSRKFIVVILAEVFSIVALFVDKISGGEFVTIASICVGAYCAANWAVKRDTSK